MDWMLFKEVVCIVQIWSLPETKLSLPHLRLRRWYTQIWTYRLKQKFFWNVMRPHFPLTSFTLAHVPYECKFNLHKWNFNQNGKKTFTCYKTHKGRLVTDKYLSKQLYIIIRILYMTGTKETKYLCKYSWVLSYSYYRVYPFLSQEMLALW